MKVCNGLVIIGDFLNNSEDYNLQFYFFDKNCYYKKKSTFYECIKKGWFDFRFDLITSTKYNWFFAQLMIKLISDKDIKFLNAFDRFIIEFNCPKMHSLYMEIPKKECEIVKKGKNNQFLFWKHDNIGNIKKIESKPLNIF